MTRPKKNFAIRLIVSLVLIVFLVRTGPALQSAQKKSPDDIQNPTPADIARDERFWIPIQEAFDIDRSIINLNNGGAHPAPRIAMNALHRYLDFANGAPTINSWGFIRPRKERLRQEIAALFGCSPEEIAITRNVTEALEIAELGIDLKPGDEVLTTTHDYPSMKNALLQREKAGRHRRQDVFLSISAQKQKRTRRPVRKKRHAEDENDPLLPHHEHDRPDLPHQRHLPDGAQARH